MKRYFRLSILPLILVIVSFGAQNLALSAWDSFVHFRSPEFTIEPGERGEPLTGQVVLVVVDGLRVDAFNKIEYVSSLKERGAYFVLKTDQPSLSYPTWATIATGASQEITGVTTNWFEGPVKQDSIFSLAEENGLKSVIVGGNGWQKLFGNVVTDVYARKWEDAYYAFDEETLDKALEYLKNNPNFLLVHFVDTDEAGHEFGGASPEYQKYADHIDSLIEKLHTNMEEDAVLMVTADHGQTDSGGHGGWEDIVTNVPLVIVGKGIKQGDSEKAEQADVAPTVSALLGLPIPPYSQGRILIEGFDVHNEKRIEIWLMLLKQKTFFVKNYLTAIDVDISKLYLESEENSYTFNVFSNVLEKSVIWEEWSGFPGGLSKIKISSFDEILEEGKNQKIHSEQLSNIPLFIVVLLVPLAAFFYARRRWKLSYRLPFLLSLFFFALYYAIFFGSGKTVSLSAVNEEDLLQQFFNEVMMYAAASLVIAGIALSFLERKKERYEVVKSTVIFSALVAFLFIIQIDVFFLYNGPLIKWYLPNMFLAFKYYLDMLALIVVGYVSIVMPLVSVGAHWVLGRLKI